MNPTSSLYDLAFRNYDPVLGRTNGVDPVAGKYSSLTPYNFAFNDPVAFNDPSGADPNSPGDVDYTGGYLDLYNSGQWSPVMDPGFGSYGVAGYTGMYSLGNTISGYNPDYGGPVSYVDNLGIERYTMPSIFEAAERQYRVQTSVSITDPSLIESIWTTLESVVQ